MIINVLQELGLAKNEARIYETLLREGECGVSTISTKSEINRRNVYDSINRLVEKGLIYEIRSANENSYRAVDPQKLNEILSEKQKKLDDVLAEMDTLYKGKPYKEEVFIYRGIEGWKNYLRDIVRIGEDIYTIGGTGAWIDPKLASFMDRFLEDIKKKDINLNILFNHDVHETKWIKTFPKDNPAFKFKFLPKEFSDTNVAVDVFGDHVVILPKVHIGGFDERSSFTVIVNKDIADSFRVWFNFMWSKTEEIKRNTDDKK